MDQVLDLRWPTKDEHDVEAVPLLFRDELDVPDVELDLRVARVEARQRLGQATTSDHVLHTDDDPTLRSDGGCARVVLGGIESAQGRNAVVQVVGTGSSETQAARPALDEADAKLVLKGADELGDRSGADLEMSRCRRQAVAACGCLEISQGAKLIHLSCNR